jgi:outer membrane protein OmpA-like peptidoglycan-associated protein
MKKFLFFLLSVFCITNLFAQELVPTETDALLNVFVTNKNGTPRGGEVIMFKGLKTKKLFKTITGADGRSALLVPKGETYKIDYKFFGDSLDYSTFEVPNPEGSVTFDLTIEIQPPKTYTLKNVLFDFGKASLRKESFETLNDLVEYLKLKPKMTIEIGGHTDNVGTPESNLKLSQERAESVRNYIISKGVSGSRVTAVGYGQSVPVADNSSDEGRQKNRRTEVKITKEQ